MNSSWMPVFFFPFLLFILRSNQWNKKKKKASLVPRPVRAIRVTRGGLEPSAIGEFSRQAWQVTSHPKSPRTTGNEAGRKQEREAEVLTTRYSCLVIHSVSNSLLAELNATLLHFSLHVSLRTKIYFGREICLSEVRFSSAFYLVKSLHIYYIQIVKYE